ncbi:DUF4260 domain-containing protein [Agrobacterium pusense]|uniref:DUF4260 domain-containing protein n=1 Tax=Agrobacterium pusense TaxID=648995 RepID=UPI0028A03ADD|nr:DUF4260 domain-containing protein [Agrobacterium pusense]
MVIALRWQQVEGAVILLCGLAVCWHIGLTMSLWLATLVFFVPDLSFAAYALGRKAGAFVYNATHIYGFGAIVGAAGLLAGVPLLTELGALWLAHSGFDRLLGYGLKSSKGFSRTHLGPIVRSARDVDVLRKG